MHRFLPFNVSPRIPAKLTFLEQLVNNLWWCWNDDAVALFERISPRIFKSVNANPLRLLSRVDQERLELMAGDDGFLSQMKQVEKRFKQEVLQSAHRDAIDAPYRCVGYFSLEYGLNENLHLYSGGLGVLAGDHLKSASDLDLPIVGVGLFYREGYFEQSVDADGNQQERYPENAIQDLPISRINRDDGTPLQVSVPLPEGELRASIWRLQVGRIPLLLLDTNTSSNPPELRSITGRLYGGDRRNRLIQELLLGIGGYRALVATGYQVSVVHMNEGHAAFLSLARLEHLCRANEVDLDVAREIMRRTSVFTTHTPVPAGNETFSLELLRPYLDQIEKTLGIPAEQVIRWGQPPSPNENGHELSMTVLGLNISNHNNGVSKLHGKVERAMWSHLWPEVPVDEVPIYHITNGVHPATWMSPEIDALATRYLGPDWHQRADMTEKLMHRIDQIPDEELWHAHEIARARLVRGSREHYESRLRARNAPRKEITAARTILDPDALTIGFARRFATYKRASLILKDLARLERLLHDRERPLQLIFAGKAHPADQEGKALIREIVQFASRRDIFRRVVFLENYDMRLARFLVRGVDVWLNTPRRPQEASGTSGMKAAMNGGLHFSVLDGWWSEGYDPSYGWVIGNGHDFQDDAYQDTIESQALFNTLENEILPCFYDRAADDVPARWVAMMKASIRMAATRFSSHRMVSEYHDTVYGHAFDVYDQLLAQDSRLARERVAQLRRLDDAWHAVRLSIPQKDLAGDEMHVGDTFTVTTEVSLGDLTPDDVDVELYYGPLDPGGAVIDSHFKVMELNEQLANGNYRYRQHLTCDTTGRFGFTARARPRNNEWAGVMPGFIRWAASKTED